MIVFDGDSTAPAPAAAETILSGLSPPALDDLATIVNSGPDPLGTWDRIAPIVAAAPERFEEERQRKMIAVLAANSRQMARSIAAVPDLLDGRSPQHSVTLQLRSEIARIAGDDLAGEATLELSVARFSDAIDAIVADHLIRVLETAASESPHVDAFPFAVIAMGKWGARELNYASDVDLVFVHDHGDLDPEQARKTAHLVASRLMSALGSQTFDGPALTIDADLRPEGSRGPLSRSLASYRRYYSEWGDAWELQALLKARFSAGDHRLGAQFLDLAQEVVWEQGLEPDALRSIRKLKERAEATADPADIKRSRGGIRDIEFTVQILQLVHGRLDPELRVPATLDAIGALRDSGLIDASDAADLAEAYRFLRGLEHRLQLWELRQTHQLPVDYEDLDRIGRSLGLPAPAGDSLLQKLSEVRSGVRDIHERLYFRPILDALIGSPTARLDPSNAALRLQGLGFTNTKAATRALGDLTAGTSRRSRVMRQLLPLMLDWLSLSPDPDMGLSQLRALLSHTPDHANLVSLLQTNPLAGERLCMLLGSGHLLGTLIDRIPEFTPRLADDARIDEVRDLDGARSRLRGLIDSRPDRDARIGTIRRFVRRRKLRIAARDVLNDAPTPVTMRSLSDTADAAIEGALSTTNPCPGFLVIAMGRWGGQELSYESDLDLIYAYREPGTAEQAFSSAADLNQILSEPSRHGDAYELDTGLRPEGKAGPVARSLEGYMRYYGEWAQPWELLALIKARPVAGDQETAAEFNSIVESVVWREELPEAFAFEVRSIKARVENERIPPGEDPDYHLKLGRGGLSDVEFLTQLLQLQHAGRDTTLRAQGTINALAALKNAEVLNTGEHRALVDAYEFCNRVRLRLHLMLGRASDSLPTDPIALGKLASSLSYSKASDLREEYRRVTRRARAVFERRFY